MKRLRSIDTSVPAEGLSCGLGFIKDFAIRRCLLATIFAVATLTNALVTAHPAHAFEGPVQDLDQEDLLWWLPADTESVVVAQGPFSFQGALYKEDKNWGKRKASQADVFLEFEQRPLELLASDSLKLAGRLKGSTVRFAMQGSRHFREPLPGLEVMDFEGCSIVVFDDSFGERGKDLIQTLAKTATGIKTIAETQVLFFHEKSGDAEWDSFITLPRPNVLLVSNNLLYLQEVLDRMTQRKSPRALPDSLPEWRYLAPGTRFWGIRHYDRTQAKEDPTSPFSNDRTFGPGDQQAIGILFALKASNPKEAVMTYLSGDDAIVGDALRAGTSSEKAEIAAFCGHEVITRDGGKTFEDEKPEEGVEYQVTLRRLMPGVLERTYRLDRTGTLSYFMLKMELALGRGMWF